MHFEYLAKSLNALRYALGILQLPAGSGFKMLYCGAAYLGDAIEDLRTAALASRKALHVVQGSSNGSWLSPIVSTPWRRLLPETAVTEQDSLRKANLKLHNIEAQYNLRRLCLTGANGRVRQLQET